jgi:hypothetical protein
MPQIRYEFIATGQADVLAAIRGVGRAATQASQQARQAATGRGAGAPSAAGRGYKSDPQMDAYWKAQVKAAEQQGRAIAKEHDKQFKETERHNAKMAAASARAAAKEKSDTERRAVAREREMNQRYDRQVKARERAAQREADIRSRTHAAEKGAHAATSRSAVWDFAGGMVAYKAASTLIDSVMSAAREAVALQESTNRLSVNARQNGQDFVDPSALRRDFQKAALANPGQSAMAISQAMQSFVSLTGELETGRQSAGTFATVASATGAEVGDVAQAAASIFNQFGLRTKEEMQDVLASLTFQGKTGAFELKDAASQFQRLAAAGASFGLTGAKGVKTIGGLAQIARTGTGSAEQTTTAIENIFSNLVAKSSILKSQGVDVFDKTGKTRDVTDVLMDSIVKAGGSNFEKKGQVLQQVFGDQGIRGVRPLLAKYQSSFQGVRNAGGSEEAAAAAGLKRLREEIDKAVNAPGSWEEVQKDAAQAQKDGSAQMAFQWERVKAIVADNIIPTFEKVSPKVFEALFGAGDDKGPAIMAVEALAEAAALAGEALGTFVDDLYATGILTRKPKSYAQQEAEAIKSKEKAEKKLAKFDEDTAGLYKPGSDQFGPIDPAKAAERERLLSEIGMHDNAAKAAHEKVWTKPGEKVTDLSTNEFVRKYMELGQQGGDASDWKGQAAYDDRVRKIAEKIEADPNYQVVGSWKDMDAGDANEAQKKLVDDYKAQQILKKGAPSGEEVPGGPQVAELAAAAERATAALNKVAAAGQPSILGGP